MNVNPSKAQLRVASAIFTNFVVLWLGSMLVTRDVTLLTIDFILAILSWYLAVKIEENLEKL